MNTVVLDLTADQYKNSNLNSSGDVFTAFHIPERLGASLRLLVWGVELSSSLITSEPQSPSCVEISRQFLSGWGLLQFEDVCGGEASVSPYQPTLGGDLHCSPDHVKLSRKWSHIEAEFATEYTLSAILEQPLGYLNLKVYAAGSVSLWCNSDDLVPLDQVDRSPDDYEYDHWRCRQLGELARDFGLDLKSS